MNRTTQSPLYDRVVSLEMHDSITLVVNPRFRANEPTLVPLARRWAWYISD